MRMFEYICRCRKRFESQFQLKQHAKYLCTEKHIHRQQFKTLFDLNNERPRRRGKKTDEKEERHHSTNL